MSAEIDQRRQADFNAYEEYERYLKHTRRAETVDALGLLATSALVFLPVAGSETTPEFSPSVRPELTHELGAASLQHTIKLDFDSLNNPLNHPENVYLGYARQDLTLAA